jgi:simple sugar transport system substrate-binding protein
MRAKGFIESMPDGVKAEKVAIGEEPEAAKDIIRSYLTANTDVNALFGSAPANKWVTDVLEELGRTDVMLLTSDESPTSLECILAGKCLASFSQEFPIQAPFAYEVLYNYQQTKMWPIQPIVTGPMVVDKNNAQVFKDAAIAIFGEDEYYKLSPF